MIKIKINFAYNTSKKKKIIKFNNNLQVTLSNFNIK